jgi:hypothetical protein
MTPRAFEIRKWLIEEHGPDDPNRPWPDPTVFAMNPGVNRYVCGTLELVDLAVWFGRHFHPLLSEGGHLAVYEVPKDAVDSVNGQQVVYMQRQGVLQDRAGITVAPERLVHRVHPNAIRSGA